MDSWKHEDLAQVVATAHADLDRPSTADADPDASRVMVAGKAE
jgi:hypothetical protein